VILGYSAAFWAGLIVAGITLGGIYALFSSGLTMIFGAAQVMNFAQGEFFMIGGYVTWFLTSTLRFSFWLALPVVAVVLGLFGAAMSATVFARIARSSRAQEIGLVLTLGLSVVFQQGATSFFGDTPRTPAYSLAQPHITIGGVTIQDLRLVALALALAALGALGWFMSRTRLGLAIRGTPLNRELARTLGIPARTVTMWAIAIGTAMSGLAAAAIAPFYGVYPTMGSAFLFTGFAILFIGGMTNVFGTLVAALAVGVVTSVAGGVLSATAASIAPLAVMAAAALLRPNGVFGTESRAV
jgi:branched-subunit amino acid ABC-type transport system permease component